MRTLMEDMMQVRMQYDEVWQNNVRDRFCRSREDVRTAETKFFSQFWQGYAWAAILGFIHGRSTPLNEKGKDS